MQIKAKLIPYLEQEVSLLVLLNLLCFQLDVGNLFSFYLRESKWPSLLTQLGYQLIHTQKTNSEIKLIISTLHTSYKKNR